jgi:hypothetical protein
MSDQLETIEDYYNRIRKDQIKAFDTEDFETGKSHFNISMRRYCSFKSPYNRRDYYKISFIIGKGTIHYGTHQLYIDQPALFFPSQHSLFLGV